MVSYLKTEAWESQKQLAPAEADSVWVTHMVS